MPLCVRCCGEEEEGAGAGNSGFQEGGSVFQDDGTRCLRQSVPIFPPLPSTMPTVCQFFEHRAPFTLRSGEVLPEFTLAYETYGRLNVDKSNVVLLFHALSGSQHAAGFCEEVPGTEGRWTEDCQAGWWSDFIGPGKALDTSKWFVVCANVLSEPGDGKALRLRVSSHCHPGCCGVSGAAAGSSGRF